MTSHEPRRCKGNRLLLHVTCQCHEGPAGFTNLVVTRDDDSIVLNPHVDNSCVLTLDEVSANALHDTLGDWLSSFPRVAQAPESTSEQSAQRV